nr:hypothetical protein [Desulforhopalus vacuolatus]
MWRGHTPGWRTLYPGFYDFHCRSTYRTNNCRPLFSFTGQHPERIDPEYQLQKTDKLLAAWVEKTVTSDFAKAFRQYMQHEQVEKIFSSDSPGPVLVGFGMKIPESNVAIFAQQNIFLADYAPIKISPKIHNSFISVANIFAVNNPR